MIQTEPNIESTRIGLAGAGPIPNAVLYNNGKQLLDAVLRDAGVQQATALPVGSVMPYAGSDLAVPTGWLLCNGQAVSRSTYAALFTVIGTTYGVGDGSTTFNLPDLRGRVLAGRDNMGNTTAQNRITTAGSGINGTTLGASGGSQTHTLTVAQMPSHNHAGRTETAPGTSGWAGVSSAIRAAYNSYTLDNQYMSFAGGNAAHNNTQPTLIGNYIIKAIADPVNTIGVSLAGTAGGDLTGTYPNPTIVNISNAPVHNSNTTLSFRTSNVERMSIDASGRVLKPGQPAFSGCKSGTTAAIQQNPWICNLAITNVGNHYNTSTGFFTCPVSGYYLCVAGWIGGSGTGYGRIRKNGVEQLFTHWNHGTSWDSIHVNAIVNCNTNDTLSFSIDGGSSGAWGDRHSSMSIYLLG